MNLFATYNPSTYQLTGFYKNQPLNNFVVIDKETWQYILENQFNYQVYFQNITPGMEITQENVLLKPVQTVDSSKLQTPISEQIATLQSHIQVLTSQVLQLTFNMDIALKGVDNATK